MMRRTTPWVVFALCVLAGGGVGAYRARQAGESQRTNAAVLVQSAWTAGRRVALRGRQVLSTPDAGGKPVEVEANVLASSRGEMRIEYLTEPLKGVTVWENGDRTYRYTPASKRLTVARKRGDDESHLEVQLLENYEPDVKGAEYVAGRPAAVVELRPRGGTGRWKRVSIDKVTSVILASEDRLGDRVLRSTRFIELRYLDQDPAPEEFRPPADLLKRYGTAQPGDTSARFEPAQLSRLLKFTVREPAWLPTGYALEGAYQTLARCRDPKEQHLAARLEYTDGLNTLTVFECGQPCKSGNCFGAGAGARMAAQEVRGEMSYLVVGDLAEADLKHVLSSIP